MLTCETFTNLQERLNACDHDFSKKHVIKELKNHVNNCKACFTVRCKYCNIRSKVNYDEQFQERFKTCCGVKVTEDNIQ